jgi:hypothetical protein
VFVPGPTRSSAGNSPHLVFSGFFSVSAGAKIPIVAFEDSPPSWASGVTQLWEPEEGGDLFRGKDVEENSELKREGLSFRQSVS